MPGGDDGAGKWTHESFDSARSPLARLDLEGRFLAVNPALEALTGRTSTELRGEPFETLWSITGEDGLGSIIDRLDAEGAVNVSVTAPGAGLDVPDASVRFVMVRGALDGTHVGFQLLTSEVLERQRSLSADPRGFELSFDQIEVGMLITGLDGVIARVNAAMARLLHRPADTLTGVDVFTTVHPDDRQGDLEFGLQAYGGEIDGWTREKRLLRSDGSVVWVLETATLVRDEDGDGVHFLSQFVDITDRKRAEEERARAEEALRESEARSRRLTDLLEAVDDVVAISDPSGRLVHLNRAGRSYLPGSDYTNPGAILDLFTPESGDTVRNLAIPAVVDEGVWTGELTMHPPGQERRVVSLSIVAHRDDEGEIEYLSAITRDITALKRVEERLRLQATTDPLTGLANRTIFFDRLANALARSWRRDSGVAVLFVDLDRFKPVNDGWGHETGDELLVEVAGRLLNSVREGDTVARIGGDEFVVLAEPIASVADAVSIGERIGATLSEPFPLVATTAHIGASVGLAVGEPGATPRSLVHAADVALYEAKGMGGAQVVSATS
jgi:diguanylate cyclase (GGDEF)-like protein/PAS domain S-box-containing protein